MIAGPPELSVCVARRPGALVIRLAAERIESFHRKQLPAGIDYVDAAGVVQVLEPGQPGQLRGGFADQSAHDVRGPLGAVSLGQPRLQRCPQRALLDAEPHGNAHAPARSQAATHLRQSGVGPRAWEAWAPPSSVPPSSPPPAPASVPEGLVDITSPMVGTLHRSPSPGEPAFVEVGSRVEPGAQLCIIEVMKLMNAVTATVGGTIAEVCFETGAPVQYGEVLFRIRADD